MTDIFPAIESGQVKALWLVATNPLTSMPNTARIRKTLEKLEFCVVQDAYADVESSQYANVFFPASVWAEKDGCFTNTERRVNRVTPVTEPLANSKPDLWIFNQMAKRWDQGRKMTFPDQCTGRVRGDENPLRWRRGQRPTADAGHLWYGLRSRFSSSAVFSGRCGRGTRPASSAYMAMACSSLPTARPGCWHWTGWTTTRRPIMTFPSG